MAFEEMTYHTLKSKDITVRLSTLGARISGLDFDGLDVVMGGGIDEKIMAGDWTTGAVCGRHAGRISNSQFVIDGVTYHLAKTGGDHQLHGGPDNFAVRRWVAEEIENGVRFSIVSPDGDQGYPGEVKATATYRINGATLSLDLEATTTKPTVINLTNHAYWNLMNGKSAFEHEVQIFGEQMLPLSNLLMPLGELRDVAGTRYDFRAPRLIGGDYDNCWVLKNRGEMKHGLTLRDPISGRRMEVHTTEIGMQFYTSFHWDGKFPGKNGPLQQYQAIAIEPQNFPDACTHKNFPSAITRPGEIYRNKMEWRFL